MIKDSDMKKYKVLIEERLFDIFEVEVPDNVDIFNYVEDEYYKCKIVLEPGECFFRRMKVLNYSGKKESKWREF